MPFHVLSWLTVPSGDEQGWMPCHVEQVSTAASGSVRAIAS
jgi:hypothetical protein